MNKLIILFFFSISFANYAQETKVDHIIAIAGKEIILQSDIEQLKNFNKSQEGEQKSDCQLLENSLMEKIMIHQAKNDTLLTVSKQEVDRQVEEMVNQYREYFKEEKKITNFFGYRTIYDLKSDLYNIQKDRFLVEKLKQKITSNLDVSPNETNEFYQKYKEELPTTKEELEMAQIVILPKISPENKKLIIKKLEEIRENIMSGKTTFAEEAILYSEDPGSASDGGFIREVKRGQMVKEFEAQAFSLDEGSISPPFESDFGFHIIKLEKKKGQILDLRHILISIKPTISEIEEAKKLTDSIHSKLITGKISFQQAAKEFSFDKLTKNNGGKMINLQTGNNLFERDKLSTKELFSIVGIDENKISSVFEDSFDQKPAFRIIKFLHEYPAHKLSIESDYERIKKMAIQLKTKETLSNWMKSEIKKVYLKLNDDYSYCRSFISFL